MWLFVSHNWKIIRVELAGSWSEGLGLIESCAHGGPVITLHVCQVNETIESLPSYFRTNTNTAYPCHVPHIDWRRWARGCWSISIKEVAQPYKMCCCGAYQEPVVNPVQTYQHRCFNVVLYTRHGQTTYRPRTGYGMLWKLHREQKQCAQVVKPCRSSFL